MTETSDPISKKYFSADNPHGPINVDALKARHSKSPDLPSQYHAQSFACKIISLVCSIAFSVMLLISSIAVSVVPLKNFSKTSRIITKTISIVAALFIGISLMVIIIALIFVIHIHITQIKHANSGSLQTLHHTTNKFF